MTENQDSSYRLHTADGRHWDSNNPAIPGTCFIKDGGAIQIKELWEWNEKGSNIMLNDIDESIITPNLFLVVYLT